MIWAPFRAKHQAGIIGRAAWPQLTDSAYCLILRPWWTLAWRLRLTLPFDWICREGWRGGWNDVWIFDWISFAVTDVTTFEFSLVLQLVALLVGTFEYEVVFSARRIACRDVWIWGCRSGISPGQTPVWKGTSLELKDWNYCSSDGWVEFQGLLPRLLPKLILRQRAIESRLNIASCSIETTWSFGYEGGGRCPVRRQALKEAALPLPPVNTSLFPVDVSFFLSFSLWYYLLFVLYSSKI